MKSRVRNRTGRLRLKHADTPVTHDEGSSTVEIRPFRNLGDWLPRISDSDQQAAQVHVDVQCPMFLKRFTLGTLNEVTDASWTGYSIKIPENVLAGTSFTIEIVIVAPPTGGMGGRILARAEPRRFNLGRAGVDGSLLGVLPKDLGDEVWRLEFSDDQGTGPCIVINSRIEEWSSVIRDDRFRATALQAILREIYSRIARLDGSETWMEDWLSLPGGRTLPNRPPPMTEDGEEYESSELQSLRDEWVDQVVEMRAGLMGPRSSPLTLAGIIEGAMHIRETTDAD